MILLYGIFLYSVFAGCACCVGDELPEHGGGGWSDLRADKRNVDINERTDLNVPLKLHGIDLASDSNPSDSCRHAGSSRCNGGQHPSQRADYAGFASYDQSCANNFRNHCTERCENPSCCTNCDSRSCNQYDRIKSYSVKKQNFRSGWVRQTTRCYSAAHLSKNRGRSTNRHWRLRVHRCAD